MQICPNCSHRNRLGVIFCDNCGASLIGDSPLNTKNINPDTVNVGSYFNEVLRSVGSDVFTQGTILRLEIEGAEPVLLKPKRETVFGRRDPATGTMPDVDLTPFAGYRMGVSRRHVVVRQSEGNGLDILDLGSSNGTYLNGQKVNPNEPQRLRDGDELRLGQMVMKIFFQEGLGEGSQAAPKTTVSFTVSDVVAASQSAAAPPASVPPVESGPEESKTADHAKAADAASVGPSAPVIAQPSQAPTANPGSSDNVGGDKSDKKVDPPDTGSLAPSPDAAPPNSSDAPPDAGKKA